MFFAGLLPGLRPPRSSPLLVLFAAWWLGSGWDLRLSLTMAVVVAGLVLVGAIAWSTQADVLLAVTVVALFWAAHSERGGARQRAGARTRTDAASSLRSYIEQGAGELFEDTNNAASTRWRWPMVPRIWSSTTAAQGHYDLAFIACSGARTRVIARAQWRGEPVDDTPKGKSQLAQLRDLVDSGA